MAAYDMTNVLKLSPKALGAGSCPSKEVFPMKALQKISTLLSPLKDFRSDRQTEF
jgi:hypothetical protein